MASFNKNPNRRELRNFGLVTGAMTAAVFGLLLPVLFDHPFPYWPWLTGMLLASWGLLLPGTMKPIYIGWMTIGHGLGWFNSRIILGIMFFLLILPAGVIMRLAGKDPMARALNGTERSYRVASRTPDRKHMEKPF